MLIFMRIYSTVICVKYYNRIIDLNSLLAQKSHFLFGPRSVGKSTLIRHQFPEARFYDLLDNRTFSKLLKQPTVIEDENREAQQVIVIDEIQKLPGLLDEVHRLIANHNWTFLLTGSSARKIKRGAANLLAGRAWWAELFPLCSFEIPDFDIIQYLNRGGLPHIYGRKSSADELDNYVALYLREEIQNESLTRSLPQFSQFLELIALSNGEEINLQSFANECGVSPMTIKNYIEILDDTLVGFSLPGYTKTKKRKSISRFKYYLFDVGVVNSICRRGEIKQGSELFGKAFEHFIMMEVRAYLSYRKKRKSMSYWRSTSQFEVDLLIESEVAIEIKSASNIQERHLKGLRMLKEENIFKSFLLICCEEETRTTKDGIQILPWREFLNRLWRGELI